MKRIFRKNRTQFNMCVNEEEFKLIEQLKEKYAINISGNFKIYLRQLWEKMESNQ